MRRALAWIMLGFGAAIWIPLIRYGEFAPAPVIALTGLILLSLICVGPATVRDALKLRRDRRREAALSREAPDPGAARLLMGDYPPYVIEAAREIRRTPDPAWLPILCREVYRLVSERTPGWREMAGAMAEAMEAIGDPKGLPALRALAAADRSGEIESLPSIIASLEAPSRLLRPSPVAGDPLLRASTDPSPDPGVLLRPEGDR